jgi:hypothetical protein
MQIKKGLALVVFVVLAGSRGLRSAAAGDLAWAFGCCGMRSELSGNCNCEENDYSCAAIG